VTYMINSSQGMVASYRYDPFGRTTSSSGSLASANPYRFSSKMVHANSDLYYYRYRFYCPEWQRWVNRDPLGEEGGKNLYAFVWNRPTGTTDPWGLTGIWDDYWWGWGMPGTGFRANQAQCCYRALAMRRGRIRGRAATEAAQDPYLGGLGKAEGPEDALRHCLGGCYVAQAMREISSCSGISPGSVIEEEETRRSNRSQIDIDNGREGAKAPPGESCVSYCRRARFERRLKPEKTEEWPVRIAR
jgi:RHS repeat-associated protein